MYKLYLITQQSHPEICNPGVFLWLLVPIAHVELLHYVFYCEFLTNVLFILPHFMATRKVWVCWIQLGTLMLICSGKYKTEKSFCISILQSTVLQRSQNFPFQEKSTS